VEKPLGNSISGWEFIAREWFAKSGLTIKKLEGPAVAMGPSNFTHRLLLNPKIICVFSFLLFSFLLF
jgi:hypothetical protein